MQESAYSDLSGNDVSFRTRNLTQEVLAKMRSILDQTMYSFMKRTSCLQFQKERKKIEKNANFPIVPTKTDMKTNAVMALIYTKYPKIVSYLDSVQPYNKLYKWMADFRKFSNQKRIRLSRQKRVEQEYLVFEHKSERHTLWATAEVGSGSMFVAGKKIYPNQHLSHDSEHIKADEEIKITKKK